MDDDIRCVGVVGCGQMGAGIAEVCARAGLDVRVAETTGEALELGRTRLTNSLRKAAERGKITVEERDAALERLSFTTDLGDFADRDLVIEAVVENEQVKTEIFHVLDQVVTRRDAILASNTSSIPLVKLAVATSRPEQVIGIHFFNPAPVQKLVELIPALTTDDQTLVRAEKLVTDVLGKHPIRAQDRAGFVVNALLIPYLLSSIRMFEAGIASREDIDNGMEMGCAHPMGPLKLSDLIGLDTVASVAESMYEEFKEPLYAAPPLLQRMVDAGRRRQRVLTPTGGELSPARTTRALRIVRDLRTRRAVSPHAVGVRHQHHAVRPRIGRHHPVARGDDRDPGCRHTPQLAPRAAADDGRRDGRTPAPGCVVEGELQSGPLRPGRTDHGDQFSRGRGQIGSGDGGGCHACPSPHSGRYTSSGCSARFRPRFTKDQPGSRARHSGNLRRGAGGGAP